jgi:hypothetical protein
LMSVAQQHISTSTLQQIDKQAGRGRGRAERGAAAAP